MNIKDIAQLAQVSAATVSKIINHKDQDISEETRKKVMKIVREYQYIPYAKVRSTGPGTTGLIGMLVPEMGNEMADFILGAEGVADSGGYSLLLCSTEWRQDKIEKQIRLLSGKNVDGIILYMEQMPDEALLEVIREEKLPFSMAGTGKFDARLSSVSYDTGEAAKLAVKYLLSLRHKAVGLIVRRTERERERRIEEGYTRALYEQKIPARSDFIRRIDGKGDIGAAVKELLASGATSIVCGRAEDAYYCCRKIRDQLMKLPEDVSVVSVQDSELLELAEPPVCAVRMPAGSMGETAVRQMMEELEGGKGRTAHKKLSPLLIERKSCGRPSERRGGKGGRIVVVGSMNMDIIMRLPKNLSNGETIIADSTSFLPGGKGANQAVGAGKLGGNVYAVGRLGGDDDGKQIYKSLVDSRVHTEGILFDHVNPTGRAYINVPPDGESSIVVYPGANKEFLASQLDSFSDIFDKARFCLLSAEISASTVKKAIELCRERGVEVMVKPSPAEKLPEGIWDKVDYLIPNEKELHQLKKGAGTVEEKAAWLYGQGVRNVIVTLGRKGCYLKNKECDIYFPAADFEAVDTTGAADSFISALAVYMSEGNGLIPSIRFATYAAGLSITREGVQPALPDRMMMRIFEEKLRGEN